MLRDLLIRFMLWLDDKTFNWRSVDWLNKHVIDRKGWRGAEGLQPQSPDTFTHGETQAMWFLLETLYDDSDGALREYVLTGGNLLDSLFAGGKSELAALLESRGRLSAERVIRAETDRLKSDRKQQEG